MDVLPLLDRTGLSIDRYDAAAAHDFVWKRKRQPYDLVVYQLGNARWHDYMWGYLFQYPGLVVLHDPGVHHARAAMLLGQRRADDYRREFTYNHPDAGAAAAEHAIEGLQGSAFYRWPMTRAVIDSARVVAVHNEFVARDLRARHPSARIERIHLGMAERRPSPRAREEIRGRFGIPADSVVFTALGLVTAEKRIGAIVRALATLVSRGANVHALVVGDNAVGDLDAMIAAHGLSGRVHVTGYVEDGRIADYLSAADVSLSLRWPSTGETSASCVEALSAGTPAIVTSLPHTADIPSSVALSIDLLNEDAALVEAMSTLAADRALRGKMGTAAREYWRQHHDVTLTAEDYKRVIAQAAATPAPSPAGLPAHLTDDYSSLAQSIASEFGVTDSR
jgi:glycosyltransferase involved in cell wall biosynthesis